MALPHSTARRTAFRGSESLSAETTSRASSSGDSSEFTVLSLGGANPVHIRIMENSFVVGVDSNHFEILVNGILSTRPDTKTIYVSTVERILLFCSFSFSGRKENRFSIYLIDPVRVQHTKVSCTLAQFLFGNRSFVSEEFKMVDTFVGGFTTGVSVVNLALAVSTANSNAIDDKSLRRKRKIKITIIIIIIEVMDKKTVFTIYELLCTG